MDLELLAAIADARPEWSLVMVGPVVKIDPADLPQRANIHYLGGKNYDELPAYLGGWDVALMPFAINESTRSSRRPRRRNISPAAGRWCRRRSPTSSATMAISRRCSSPTAPKPSSRAARQALALAAASERAGCSRSTRSSRNLSWDDDLCADGRPGRRSRSPVPKAGPRLDHRPARARRSTII